MHSVPVRKCNRRKRKYKIQIMETCKKELINSFLEYLPYSNFQKSIISAEIRYLINFRSNSTINPLNSTIEELMCCSGFCIDLLAKFGEELQFEYDLIRVTDPKWGVLKVRKVLFF